MAATGEILSVPSNMVMCSELKNRSSLVAFVREEKLNCSSNV